MNEWGIPASRQCRHHPQRAPGLFKFLSSGANDTKVILGIEKCWQQELLSLMAENRNACMTSEHLNPTPGFFSPYLVRKFLDLRSAPLKYESWTLNQKVVASYNVYLHIECTIEPGIGMRCSSGV